MAKMLAKLGKYHPMPPPQQQCGETFELSDVPDDNDKSKELSDEAKLRSFTKPPPSPLPTELRLEPEIQVSNRTDGQDAPVPRMVQLMHALMAVEKLEDNTATLRQKVADLQKELQQKNRLLQKLSARLKHKRPAIVTKP